MKRLHPVVAALALAAPLSLAPPSQAQQGKPAAPRASKAPKGKVKIVTDASSSSSVSLKAGDTLLVRLKSNPSTGYSWAALTFPDMPIRLVGQRVLPLASPRAGGPVVGGPRTHEWKFVVSGRAPYTRSVWLKMLQLRPFERGTGEADLWEVNVSGQGS